MLLLGPLRINVSVTVVEMEDEDDYDSGVESSVSETRLRPEASCSLGHSSH